MRKLSQYVWLAVWAWCGLPAQWFSTVSTLNWLSRGAHWLNGSSPQVPETGTGLGLLDSASSYVTMTGGAVLLAILAYGAWCAAGVIMGLGAERGIQAVFNVKNEDLVPSVPSITQDIQEAQAA